MTDEDVLLAAIRANPGDDLPRLALADWLDEQGGWRDCPQCKGTGGPGGYDGDDAPMECFACLGSGQVPTGNRERAEFIRVQLKSESAVPCRDCSVWSRRDCESPGCKFGLDDRCLILLQSFKPDIDMPYFIGGGGPGETRFGIFFRRGFAKTVRCSLERWLAHGSRIVRIPVACVERVKVTDREPLDCSDRRFRWFRKDPGPDEANELPEDVFVYLGSFESLEGFVSTSYDTESAARDALSAACIAWAWGQEVES